MRIDSHQHFWRYNARDYVWMTDAMESLRRDYLPADLLPSLRASGFARSIAVQARQMVSETEFLLDLAEKHDFIAGVVGWVDFSSKDLATQLDRFASHEKFRGVRELIHDMADLDYATSADHIRGVSLAGQLGLTYDLLLKPPHLRPALELVRLLSDQRFVVDHLAKPDIASGRLSPWREDIIQLAQFEQVFCKLSGMVTEASWSRWRASDFWPYLDTVLEAFGPQRLMIGSDWPVCTLAGEYSDVMGIVIDFVERLSATEQEQILGGNCASFYGLPTNAKVSLATSA